MAVVILASPNTPAHLLKGLIFGADGRALSPTHTRRHGRLYRYYVAQRLLKGQEAGENIVHRISAAEIGAAVTDQVRALLRQPEVLVGTWMAAEADSPKLTEAEVRDALCQLDPLWDELFPIKQARIVRLLVERIEIGPGGADIRLRVEGLASLVRDLGSNFEGGDRECAERAIADAGQGRGHLFVSGSVRALAPEAGPDQPKHFSLDGGRRPMHSR